MTAKSVHEVVRQFVATRERFTAAELETALRAAGHAELAARIVDDPRLIEALVNEHT